VGQRGRVDMRLVETAFRGLLHQPTNALIAIQFVTNIENLHVAAYISFLFSNFCLVLNAAFFLLGDTSASEYYVQTFRNTLFKLHRWGQEEFPCSKNP